MLTMVAMILAGTPFLRKSTLLRYSWPISSSCVALRSSMCQRKIHTTAGATHAVWFGKPETGMPMPVEQMRPVMKMRRLDLSPPGMFFPTCCAMGTRSTLAIVWLMNVEMTYGARQHARLYERKGERKGGITRTMHERRSTTG